MDGEFLYDLALVASRTPDFSTAPVGTTVNLLPDAFLQVGLTEDHTNIPTLNTAQAQNYLTVQVLNAGFFNSDPLKDRTFVKLQVIEDVPYKGQSIFQVAIDFVRRYLTPADTVSQPITDEDITITGNRSGGIPIPASYISYSPSPPNSSTDGQGNVVYRIKAAVRLPKVSGLGVVFLVGDIGMSSLRSKTTFETLFAEYVNSTTAAGETLDDENPDTDNLLTKKRKYSCENPDGQLTINFTTDAYGGNLAEVIIAIADNSRYPCGYPRKLIARNKNVEVSGRKDGLKVTYYAKRPRIYKILRGKGDYDLMRIIQIKQLFGVPGDLASFYISVMSYATVKYGLAGLITGEFTVKWLYASRNAEFFELLANSQFASLISFFDAYVGYEQYFRPTSY